MLYQFKSYIKFLWHSTNQHGVHSPFVYDLVTQCFYDKKWYEIYAVLSRYRKQLLKSKKVIEVTDFGQGSRVFSSHKRKVSSIAKIAGITPKRQELLFRLAAYFQSESILELGTSLGLGTIALSKGHKDAEITTVEGCPETAKEAQRMLDKFHASNVHLAIQSFDEFFKENPVKDYDLVYLDGNHHKEMTLSYFHSLLNHNHNDSIFIFDDIHWSKEMNEAWMEITRHPRVTVSIDTFFWGFVFFRTEQPKQHFTIRM
jgi:predicted O-methyltransferase YrrM